MSGDGQQLPGVGRPDTFFVKPGYQARLQPDYFTDAPPPEIVYQPEVYGFAADLAERASCRAVIDIGCGNGDKLAALHPRFEITGHRLRTEHPALPLGAPRTAGSRPTSSSPSAASSPGTPPTRCWSAPTSSSTWSTRSRCCTLSGRCSSSPRTPY